MALFCFVFLFCLSIVKLMFACKTGGIHVHGFSSQVRWHTYDSVLLYYCCMVHAIQSTQHGGGRSLRRHFLSPSPGVCVYVFAALLEQAVRQCTMWQQMWSYKLTTTTVLYFSMNTRDYNRERKSGAILVRSSRCCVASPSATLLLLLLYSKK